LLLSAPLVLLMVSPASPHAIVLEGSLVHDAVLERAPGQVTLRFNSKLEKRFTRITLAAGDRPPAPVALPSDADPSQPDRTVIPLSPLATGDYVLRYRVLAVDGHITGGRPALHRRPAAVAWRSWRGFSTSSCAAGTVGLPAAVGGLAYILLVLRPGPAQAVSGSGATGPSA
jgi:methionine-rich copper-binding protein CopC